MADEGKTFTIPTDFTYSLHQSFEPFDSGWRSFDAHYLLYASSGIFHLEIDGMSWLLPPQRAAWIAAKVPVRIHANQPVVSSSVLFAEATTAKPDFDCRVFTVSPLAQEMIEYAMRWGRDRLASDAIANNFFVSLDNVCRELSAEPNNFWLPRARSAELEVALTHTLAHLNSNPTFSETAQAAHVSERTLARRFAEEINMTWSQFLRRARLLKAMALLGETENKIVEIAHAVGFNSISAFNHAFRAFVGETPSTYRKRS